MRTLEARDRSALFRKELAPTPNLLGGLYFLRLLLVVFLFFVVSLQLIGARPLRTRVSNAIQNVNLRQLYSPSLPF